MCHTIWKHKDVSSTNSVQCVMCVCGVLGEGYRGLSMRKNHSKDRSVCLNDFRTYYPNNTLPLVYTNARVVYHPGKDWYVEDGKNNKYT